MTAHPTDVSATPESGDIFRGLLRPDEWRLNVRTAGTCVRCGRDVNHWRRPGKHDVPVRCNGEHRASCGQILTDRNTARQRAEAAATKHSRDAARRATKKASAQRQQLWRAAKEQEKRDAVEAARLAVERAVRDAEAARLALCPRPDKDVWLTREVAEQVIRHMRETGRPGALDLHAYECDCGVWHVGNRMAGPPQRFGSAYEVAL